MSRTLVTVACLIVAADALRLEAVFDRRAVAAAIAAAPLAGLAQAASAANTGGKSNAAMDGIKKAPNMESAASNIVLGVASDQKPTFKEFKAELDDKAMASGGAGFQGGKLTDQSGAAYKKTSLTGSPGDAAALASRKGGNIPTIRIAGKWNDPAHPGCVRRVQLAGTKAFINGADEDGKPWKVVGLISGNDVTIDFTPKGGPKDVTASYVIGKGLVFPDGNVWTKAS
jgi:hypothetical protein